MRTVKPEESEIIIQKLPCDMGIHRNPRKGTLNAPDKLLEGFNLDQKVLVDEVFPDEFNLERTHKRIGENMKDLASYGKPVLSIGGDHSVSFPVVKALKEKNPDLKLVWLDSHLDLKEKIDHHVSHDVVIRELLEHGFSEDEIFFVGVTRIDEDEEEFLGTHDLKVYRPDDLEEFLERDFPGDYYLSVDIDVLSEDTAPGTGYPDGELGLEDVEKVISEVSPVHGDIVEIAPVFDRRGKTVKAGRKVMKALSSELVFES